MAVKKKRDVALALVGIVMVAAGLLGWGLAQPADAKPGYTCNPDPGHGNPGCHVPVTAPPPPPTTAAPPPPTTKAPAPATTKTPTPATTKAPASTPSPTTTPAAGAAASTTTIAGQTTTSVDSTTTTMDPTTTTLAPTTTMFGTTTTTDPSEAIAGGVGTGGGGGPSGGWIAFMALLGILAMAGWIGLAVKWAGDRRTSAGPRATTGDPVRFVLAERLSHWFYAFCFLAAGITGALMWIPSTAQWMAGAYTTVSRYHGYMGIAMVIVPLLIFLVLDCRRLAEDRRELDHWDANDRRWLWTALSGGMFRGKKLPPQGRFNAGQKLNSHLVAALALGFVVTGSLLMARAHLPYWLTAGVLFCHKILAVTGGTLLVGHVAMALLTRHGRGGLRAMVKGTLPVHIAREGHSLWYADWLRQKAREGGRVSAADGTGRAAPATPPSA